MIKQLAAIEEQEAIISIDYLEGVVSVYTNKAFVMNRINAKGFTPTYEYVKGEIFGAIYEIPMKDLSKIMHSTIFKSYKQY